MTEHTILVDKILNIFAVLSGGVLTYIVNVKMSNREHALKMMYKKNEEVLIPLCTNIEDIRRYLLDSKELISFNRDKEFIRYSSECTKFLKANKRLYLDKNSRELLSKYEGYLNKMECKLKLLLEEIYDVIEKNMKEILYDYIQFVDYAVRFTDSSSKKIEEAILKHEDINGLFLISEITFIFNHKDDMSNEYIIFKLGDEFYNKVWNVYEAIELGHIGYYHLNINSKEEEALDLMKHLNDNFEDINIKINKLVKENEIKHMYRNLLEILDRIRDHLINEIDKISDY